MDDLTLEQWLAVDEAIKIGRLARAIRLIRELKSGTSDAYAVLTPHEAIGVDQSMDTRAAT